MTNNNFKVEEIAGSDYMQNLRERTRLTQALRRQGWSDDFTEFGVGNTMFQRGRAIEVRTWEPSKITCAGNLEGWRRMTMPFGKAGAEGHALTLLASLASPLLPLIGLSPMAVCPFGAPSVGKTIIARIASAAWRDPFSLMLPVHHSTPDRPNHFRECGALPAILDSAHLLPRRELRKIVDEYGIGAGRILRSDNTSYPVSWSGVLMIFERTEFSGTGFDSPVFDYPLANVDIPWATLSRLEHFGVAGAGLAEYLVGNVATIKSSLATAESKMAEILRLDPRSRNLLALVACIAVISEIAQALGVIGFDPKPVVEFAQQRARNIAATPTLIKSDVSDAVLNEVVRLRGLGKKQSEIAAETGVTLRSVKAAFRIAKCRGML